MRISWCVEQIIFPFINCSCRYVHSCITGCIVDINISVIFCNCTVCKYYVRNISDSLFSKRNKKYTGWLSDHFGRIIQICSEYIENITKSCCCISYTVSNIDPAFLTSDRHCTCTVLGLCQRMTNSLADNLLFIDHCMLNIVTKTKSDSSVDSCIALCYCKERFTVISLYADNQIIFSVQLNSTGIHHCIDSETFLKIGVCLRIQVISPFNRRKFSCQYRILITIINSIIKICFLIFSCDQFFYFRFFNIILFIQHFSSSLLLPYTYARCDTGISMVLQ